MNTITRLVAASAIAMCVGCNNTHLRWQTSRHAATLNDIVEQQVLDNLALFAVNPEATPFFEVPDSGASDIQGEGALEGSPPLNPFFTTLGFNVKRGSQIGWILKPVVDTHRLTLMKCAYQRAVGHASDECQKCCEKEKAFFGYPDEWVPVVDDHGTPVPDPRTGDWYVDPDTGVSAIQADGTPAIDPKTGERKYYIRKPVYDCEECAIESGWLCVSCNRADVSKCGCRRHGHYCGTYVWVAPGHEAAFGRLSMRILEFATRAPVIVEGKSKKVTFNIDRWGHAVAESESVGSVEATLDIDEPVSNALAQRVTSERIEANLAQDKAAQAEVEAVRKTQGSMWPRVLGPLGGTDPQKRVDALEERKNKLPASVPKYRRFQQTTPPPSDFQFQLRQLQRTLAPSR